MALLTAAAVRARIPGLSSADDAELALVIAGCEADAAVWLMLPQTAAGTVTMESSAYVDLLDGPVEDDRATIRLRARHAVVSVEEITAWGDEVPSADYELDEGVVRLVEGAASYWPRGKRAIRVEYTSGWVAGETPTVPPQVLEALLLMVRDRWQRRHVAQVANAAESEQPAELVPPDAARLLSRWRRWEAAVGG